MDIKKVNIQMDVPLDNQTMRNCRVLNFTSEWSLDDILTYVLNLNPQEYHRLFYFTIEIPISGNAKILEDKMMSLENALVKNFKDRPIILEILSNNKIESKYLYKETNFDSFVEIVEPNEDSVDLFWNFLNGDVDIETLDIKELLKNKDAEIIFRLIHSFNLPSTQIYTNVLKECAKFGKKSQFLVALDPPFVGEMENLDMLSTILDGSIEESILSLAVISKNQEITKFLISDYTDWISRLPFDHQLKISTSAYVLNLMDILCDLLEIADFPFPENFKIDCKDNKILQIVYWRSELENAIQNENLEEISRFAEKYPRIKIAYNISNKSARYQAFEFNKIKSASELRRFNFVLSRNESIPQQNKFYDFKDIKSVSLLKARALIHNTLNKNLVWLSKRIGTWYHDIYRTSSAIIDAAAKIDDLKVIFDFESESDDIKDIRRNKYIFIGAKITDMRSEQRVKGVIARELCHLIIGLIYKNNRNPYFENDNKAKQQFHTIASRILRIYNDQDEMIDDQCDGIISSVYNSPSKENQHRELIVRPLQILVTYDNDPERLQYLKQRYKLLFHYFFIHILPELVKFNYDQSKTLETSAVISTEFTLDENDFTQKFISQIHIQSKFDTLKIKNVPSIESCSKLLYLNWFTEKICSRQNLFGVILLINQKIDESCHVNFNIFNFKHNNSIFIAFQSTIDEINSITYWKIPGRDKFFQVYIDDDKTEKVASFFQKFLIREIKDGKSGIIENFQHKQQYRLQQIGDSNGNNLLRLAILSNEESVVKELLEHDFDGDDAVDVAWENFEKANRENNDKLENDMTKIILILLEYNSRLPSNFDYDKASNEIQEFIKKCEDMRKEVDNNNNEYKELKRLRKESNNLVYFYDRKNQSLLTYILKANKVNCLDLLDREIFIGCHEKLTDNEINKYQSGCKEIREKNILGAKESSDTHLFILRSRSRISHNDQFYEKRWNLVDEAYNAINDNEYCKKIMKVAASFGKTKIFFDFKNPATNSLDPATSQRTSGIIYQDGTIFIGAKNLLEEGNKFKVFGVLAHELCHLAVLVTFMNPNFDPFPLGESEEKTKFISEVMVQCKNLKDHEPIVSNVFESYIKEHLTSEMIVTLPQMLMEYMNESDKKDNFNKNYNLLVKYSKDIVEPELDRALDPLKLLENNEIKFADLTSPMKAKILNSQIIFQGIETTLIALIGNDEDILKLLTIEDIRNVLLNSKKKLEIGFMCKLNSENKNAERTFICLGEQNREIDINTMEQEIRLSKIMLLADHAGMGKSTVFKDLAVKVKKNTNNSWVSFINLKQNVTVFNRFKNKGNVKSSDEVIDLLLEIIRLTDQINEVAAGIFVKLYSEGRIIFFFDGVDEICPKHTDTLTEIFKTISESNNQMWISTRPRYADIFSKALQTTPYKFSSKIDTKMVIEKVLTSYNIENNPTKSKIFESIRNQFSKKNSFNENLTNPLIIEIITKLWIGKFEHEWKSKHGLYLNIIKMQNERNGGKILAEYQPPISKFSVWLAHHVYALKLIIGDDFEDKLGFKLEDLAIMKQWKEEEKNWSSDMIQRYGILTVSNDESGKAEIIDFIHETYAEFFVALFLIEFLFSENHGLNDDEIKMKFSIFDAIMSPEHNHEVVDFMFIKNEPFSKDKKIGEKVKKHFLDAIVKIHQSIQSKDLNAWLYFENYAKVLSIDIDISKKLWKTDDGVLALKTLIVSTESDDFSLDNIVTTLAEQCFGPNWHEYFNKSNEKLITDEEIEVDQKLKSEEKNLLKYCDLVNQVYDKNVLNIFYSKINLRYIMNGRIRREIIEKMKNKIDTDEFVTKCMTELFDYTISAQSVAFSFRNIEELCQKCKLKEIFLKDEVVSTLVNKIFQSNEPGIFEILGQFYLNFCSEEELKNILIESDLLETSGMKNYTLYDEYTQFYNKISVKRPKNDN